MATKKTQEEFNDEVKSKNTHNLDLTNFVYVNNITKSKVKCLDCGYEWETSPAVLLKNHGCPKCAVEFKARKLSDTPEEFIKKAQKVHGDKYIYDKVYDTYINERSKILIGCKIHGYFEQVASCHKNGEGCPLCNGGVTLSKESFLESITKSNTHDIDFSEFEYKNSTTKGKCKCNVCGNIWYTTPISLKSNAGCPECSKKSRVSKRTYTLEDFVRKYKERYPFSTITFENSVYVNSLTYMIVNCPEHGEFITKPNWLMSGSGCPYCKKSSLENEIEIMLITKGIKYARFFRNKDMLDRLTLDFYLPEYNTAIECQGEQHYEATEFFGGEKKFKERSYRDHRKLQLCQENGIKLLHYTNYKGEIPVEYHPITYFDKDKLLNEIRPQRS